MGCHRETSVMIHRDSPGVGDDGDVDMADADAFLKTDENMAVDKDVVELPRSEAASVSSEMHSSPPGSGPNKFIAELEIARHEASDDSAFKLPIYRSNDANILTGGIWINVRRIAEMGLAHGDIVLVKGSHGKFTALNIMGAFDYDTRMAGVNRHVRHNLHLKAGDPIRMYHCTDIEYANHAVLTPYAEDVVGVSVCLLKVYIYPYVNEAYRPALVGDVFSIRGSNGHTVKFKLQAMWPRQYGILSEYCTYDWNQTPIVLADDSDASAFGPDASDDSGEEPTEPQKEDSINDLYEGHTGYTPPPETLPASQPSQFPKRTDHSSSAPKAHVPAVQPFQDTYSDADLAEATEKDTQELVSTSSQHEQIEPSPRPSGLQSSPTPSGLEDGHLPAPRVRNSITPVSSSIEAPVPMMPPAPEPSSSLSVTQNDPKPYDPKPSPEATAAGPTPGAGTTPHMSPRDHEPTSMGSKDQEQLVPTAEKRTPAASEDRRGSSYTKRSGSRPPLERFFPATDPNRFIAESISSSGQDTVRGLSNQTSGSSYSKDPKTKKAAERDARYAFENPSQVVTRSLMPEGGIPFALKDRPPTQTPAESEVGSTPLRNKPNFRKPVSLGGPIVTPRPETSPANPRLVLLKCGRRRTPTRRRAYHTNVGCARASALGPASGRTGHHVMNTRRWRGGMRALALARAHTPP